MKISHLHSTKGREPYGLFVLLVQLDFTISDGYLDHYMFVNLKFDMDEKQYDDFIGRIKIIDNYENVPIRYRRLIESGNWEYL